MGDLISLLNVVAIIAIGIIGFRAQWLMASKIKEQWRWIKQGLAVVCLAWAALYFFILLDILHIGTPINLDFLRNWFVRPMVTITLTLIASSGIARRKTDG